VGYNNNNRSKCLVPGKPKTEKQISVKSRMIWLTAAKALTLPVQCFFHD